MDNIDKKECIPFSFLLIKEHIPENKETNKKRHLVNIYNSKDLMHKNLYKPISRCFSNFEII